MKAREISVPETIHAVQLTNPDEGASALLSGGYPAQSHPDTQASYLVQLTQVPNAGAIEKRSWRAQVVRGSDEQSAVISGSQNS